jgi:hypothetical protein
MKHHLDVYNWPFDNFFAKLLKDLTNKQFLVCKYNFVT